MKRIVLCLIAFAFLVTSCGGGKEQSATDAVSKELDHLKAELEDVLPESFLETSQYNSFIPESYPELLEKLKEFDYEIVDEEVSADGSSSTVKVKITTYRFGEVLTSSINDLMSMAMMSAFSNESSGLEVYIESVVERMATLANKDYSKTVSIEAIKKGDEWSVELDGNSDLKDAVTGGIFDAFKLLEALEHNTSSVGDNQTSISNPQAEESSQAMDSNQMLEEYLELNPEFKDEMEEMANIQGLDINIEGNTILFQYNYDEVFDKEMIDTAGPLIEQALESYASSYKDFVQNVESETGIKGVIVRITYSDSEGKEIHSQEYMSENTD